MKDKRIVEGREMKVERAEQGCGMTKREQKEERDGKHLSVRHSASLNWENKRDAFIKNSM